MNLADDDGKKCLSDIENEEMHFKASGLSIHKVKSSSPLRKRQSFNQVWIPEREELRKLTGSPGHIHQKWI